MDHISCSIRQDHFMEDIKKASELNIDAEIIFIGLNSIQKIRKWQIENQDHIKQYVKENKISVFQHGYFYDIDIGATDEFIRDYSLKIILNDLEFANYIGASQYIMHNFYKPGIVNLYFDEWFENYKKSMSVILETAEQFNLRICVKNMWDNDFYFTSKLLQQFKTDYLGLCIDIAHLNVYSEEEMDKWIQEFSHRTFSYHINDNDGNNDSHMIVGNGNINFDKFFRLHNEYTPDARINIENFDDFDSVEKSLTYIKDKGFLDLN